MNVVEKIKVGKEADTPIITLTSEEVGQLHELIEAAREARLCFSDLSNEASDHAFIIPELNDTWNEGGSAYEASGRLKNAFSKIERQRKARP